MPFLANDRLDPKLSHGDVSIILEAGHNDTVQFALRQLMRRTRSELTLRWMIDGYARGIGAGATLGGRDAAKPVGIQGWNGQPRRRRRHADGRARLGAARRRRARVGGRRFVSGRPHHPDVRRVLGSHPPRRAGDAHRPQEGQRRPARDDRRVRRSRLRRGPRRQADSSSTPTFAWPTPARRRPNRTSSCAGGSTTRADSTAQADSTRGWRSSPTSAACRRASSPCRTGSRASRWRSTSCRSAVASSSCCQGLPGADRYPRRPARRLTLPIAPNVKPLRNLAVFLAVSSHSVGCRWSR